MRDEIYADGIGEISVTGAIMRIDLVSLSPTEKNERGEPQPVLRQRIIMPIEGFANAMDLMQKAYGSLIEAGAIRRVSEDSRVVELRTGEARTSESAPLLPNTSPNFN